ncbi:MAG: glycosyltransferase family 2 protein [Bacteroidota bacterium]
MSSPRVGILMPVYNVAPFIRDSVQSILDQTYRDFELLIVDDCSTDDTVTIIQSFQDNRIKLIRNEVNMGLVYGLNLGLKHLQNDYLARMDGDDLALPTRLECQVRFMDENADVVMCGTQAYWEEVDHNGDFGKTYEWDYSVSDEAIRVSLLWSASFVHPSVIIRGDVFRRNQLSYDDTYTIACEDWHMWIRLSQFGLLANLNERLVRYRIRKGSLHRSNPALAMQLNQKVRRFYLTSLGMDDSVIRTMLKEEGLVKVEFKGLLNTYKIFFQHIQSVLDGKRLSVQIGNRMVDVFKNNKLGLISLFHIYTSGFRPDFTYLKKAIKYAFNK